MSISSALPGYKSFFALLFLFIGGLETLKGQTFIVDPARSSISISGKVGNSDLKAQGQGTGSLSTTYVGTIQAEATSASIRFPGESRVIAQNSGSWQPKKDGTAGNEPANYGVQADPLVLTTAKAALRDLQVDILSADLPLSDGDFDSRALTFVFLTNANSTISYLVSGLINETGSKTLAGYATNSGSTQATLTTVGSEQTLTIPVDATFFLTLLSTNDTTVRLLGQVVATRSVVLPLQIASLSLTNQVATLQWDSSPGLTFQVWAAQDFEQWQLVAEGVTSTNSAYTWSELVTNSLRFYRISLPAPGG